MDLRRIALTAVTLPALVAAPAAAQEEPDTTALNEAAIEWIGRVDGEALDSTNANLDPQAVAQGLSVEAVLNAWSQITAQTGALDTLEPGTVATSQGYWIVDLVGTFANATMTVRVAFNDEMQVSGFFVRPPGGGGG